VEISALYVGYFRSPTCLHDVLKTTATAAATATATATTTTTTSSMYLYKK
jgi:hypothetical protein